MKVRFNMIFVAFLVIVLGCNTPNMIAVPAEEGNEAPSIQKLPTIPPAAGQLTQFAPSNIARVWANTGEDKVTRDELRSTYAPEGVLNSVWDGTGISLFGARNEVVSFNLVLEVPTANANDVTITLASLSSSDGASITTKTAAGDDLFNYVGRNIELFYVRYLEIKGVSTDLFIAGYNYDERHIPERCRRPYDEYGEGSGIWTDRPCHNLFYPDIAVPLELHSPFTIPSGTNQSIWGDIYIPTSAPAGEYAGVISITESDVLTWEIPIQLNVRDFTLPDLPNALTMLDFSYENISERYLGEVEPSPGTNTYTQSLLLADRHFQMAHRHKISLIDSYIPIDQMDDVWLARLNGQLFTTEEGYDGIGVGVGNNVFSIGTYGSWPWQDGTQSDMWDNSNQWVDWFEAQAFDTPTEYFLYLIDESDDYEQIEEWAQWINNNPGSGQALLSFATIDLPIASENTPALDIPASWATVGLVNEWQEVAEEYASDPEKRFYLYNSNRPVSGSFAIEDDGVALRELAWGQYKMAIDRWFYWEATYYVNYQCYGNSAEAQTNVFQQAQTYGCLDGFDDSLGETGWNYVNGDGVLLYPGTDLLFSADNYGIMGPFASLRLKFWRRGIQDVDYLTLAMEIDPERTTQIIEEMIPVVLWEVGVEEFADPTYVFADISWSTDPDVWEAARAELADIIESANP